MRLTTLAMTCCFALALAGCGGGGGSDTVASNQTPPGSIDRSGRSTGTVSGFGSIFVNGIEFQTQGATITKDGQSAMERDLKVGQVVTVTGTRNENRTSGTATSVAFDDNVEGPIRSIDVGAGRLVVLGQTVIVDTATVFDDNIAPRDITGLAINDVVEVSGFIDASGNIVASRIEKKPAGGVFEIVGVVSGLNTGTRTFNLNAQLVDYSTAQLRDFNGATIANGDLVEVKGSTFVNPTLQASALLATSVEKKSAPRAGQPDQQAEVEGLITRFASASSFDVAGIAVVTTSSTVFEKGTAANLVLGAKVEVHGTVNASGALVATRIEIKMGGNLRVTGRVQARDTAANSLRVLGVDVRVGSSTQFEDESSQEEVPFNLSRINVGEYVQVRGFAASGNFDVDAIRVERRNVDNKVEVRGPVENISRPQFTVLGVVVTTNSQTEFEGFANADAFFSALTTGRLVEAQGIATGDAAITADEVEFED